MNPEIFCIDNGVNSSESKGYNDYGDESMSNKVQVMFIGGNEQVQIPTSLLDENYESDKLEEEKVGNDGVLKYFKGKPKKSD